MYEKQYAPFEWKRTQFGFDMLNIDPWLERVAAARSDLEFYDVCVDYVASLQDTHVFFGLPSDFVASLNLSADLYDGKVLIEAINRAALPVGTYPFAVGDEVISVDGKDVEILIGEFSKYARQGNERSTRRLAVARIFARPQSRMPYAAQLGDSATVVIRRATGADETYTIPWTKTGTPLHVGPVPTPDSKPGVRAAAADDYTKLWFEMQYSAVDEPHGLLNYGVRNPYYVLPSNFVQRLGRVPADFFFSGTYEAEGLRIGYIRIPNYGSLAASVQQQFDTEIAYFEQNTDGLVVDDTRNTGGFLCFGENIVSRLVPYPFTPTHYELRATWSRVNSFYNSLNSARAQGAEQWLIDLYEFHFNNVYRAYTENRGRTGPTPLCTPFGVRPPVGPPYTKPLIMLVDEFSTSTADSVPAMIQDARRGPIFGYRSNGAGGTNTSFDAGVYGESVAGVTLGLMTRQQPLSTPGYPDSYYIENVGVQPDIPYDYMTRENLMQSGRPFVAAFTAAIVEQIRRSRQ
jgi:hypothetical protein